MTESGIPLNIVGVVIDYIATDSDQDRSLIVTKTVTNDEGGALSAGRGPV
jgi:hypothetical protein